MVSMVYDSLTPERACDALAELGLPVAPRDVRLERCAGRWLAWLPGERLAWFAADEDAAAALAVERRLLRVLARRCSFAVPRVLLEAPDGGFDVRSVVPGVCDPRWVDARIRADADAAARLGASIGALLAELHTLVAADEVAEWLPAPPEPASAIADPLSRIVADAALLSRADRVLARVQDVPADADRVLVHGALGFHNLGVDPETFTVVGVSGWESARLADRHVDFGALAGGLEREPLLDAALAVYEPAAGRTLSRERILLHGAGAAIRALAAHADLSGEPPDAEGLDAALAEARAAIDRALDGA